MFQLEETISVQYQNKYDFLCTKIVETHNIRHGYNMLYLYK